MLVSGIIPSNYIHADAYIYIYLCIYICNIRTVYIDIYIDQKCYCAIFHRIVPVCCYNLCGCMVNRGSHQTTPGDAFKDFCSIRLVMASTSSGTPPGGILLEAVVSTGRRSWGLGEASDVAGGVRKKETWQRLSAMMMMMMMRMHDFILWFG